MGGTEARIDDVGRWETTLGVCVVVLVFSQVLINPAGFDQFQLPKLFVQSIAVIVALAAIAITRGVVVHRTFLPLAALLATLAASALLSVAPRVSLLGSPARRFGLAQWLLLAGAFVIGSTLADPERRRRLILMLLAASAPVAAYAVAQRLNLDPFDQAGASTQLRPGSTFGSAAALGGYLSCVVVVGVGAIVTRAASLRWLAPVVALDLVALVITQSRGAWIGALVGIVAVLGWAWKRDLDANAAVPVVQRTVARVTGAILIVTIVTALAVPGIVTRAASLGTPTEGTAGGRIELAQMAVGAVADRPILGWGPDLTRAPLREQFASDFEARFSDDRIEDRAHNSALDVALVGGLVGLAAAAWFVAALALAAWRQRDEPSVVIAGFGVIAFAGHLAFNFPIPELDIVVWLLAGTLAASHRVTVSGATSYVAGGAAAVAVLAITVVSLDAFGADRALRIGVDAENRGELAFAGEQFADVVASAPDSSRAHEVRTRWMLRAGDPIGAIASARAAVAADPSDPYQVELLARALNAAALSPLGDPRFAVESEELTSKLVATSPNDGSAHLELGTALAALGRTDEAVEAYQRAALLIPRRSEPLRNLGLLAENRGDLDVAAQFLEQALAVNPRDEAAAIALDRVGAQL